MYWLFQDPLMVAVMIPAMLLAFGAQIFLKSRVGAMSKIQNAKGLTGAQVAQAILDRHGIQDVRIEEVGGFLTDHYSPSEKVLRLSPEIYGGRTVTSMGVAAHEVGHAIQHQEHYAPLAIRQTIAPAASIGSTVGLWLVPLFISIGAIGLVKIGILIFAISTFFTLVTLPVEFNASSRALAELEAMQLTWGEEWVAAKKVLDAAALTYVAAAATSIMYLIYFILRAQGLSRRD